MKECARPALLNDACRVLQLRIMSSQRQSEIAKLKQELTRQQSSAESIEQLRTALAQQVAAGRATGESVQEQGLAPLETRRSDPGARRDQISPSRPASYVAPTAEGLQTSRFPIVVRSDCGDVTAQATPQQSSPTGVGTERRATSCAPIRVVPHSDPLSARNADASGIASPRADSSMRAKPQTPDFRQSVKAAASQVLKTILLQGHADDKVVASPLPRDGLAQGSPASASAYLSESFCPGLGANSLTCTSSGTQRVRVEGEVEKGGT